MNKEPLTSKSRSSTYVEIKRVTWNKDSHGLFDYESKSVNFSKNKVEQSSNIYKEENDITIRPIETPEPQMELEEPNFLFSIDVENDNRFTLRPPQIHCYESNKSNLFLIVRSLKNEDGVQRGYTLELGDIIRLGRVEYRVIEYQDNSQNRLSLFELGDTMESGPFKLVKKTCELPDEKTTCRVCLLDQFEQPGVLINPCNCKGGSAFVHVVCLQQWINSKVKFKENGDSSCSYWKHLICEVCKAPLPDMLEVGDEKIQLVPTVRPEGPFLLVERVFYDKSKGSENSRMMILLNLKNDKHTLKLGRGHECDIRENDISVSRLHAYIKYQDSKFVVVDNNSKFGTLILLRKEFEIEKRKIAVQVGRTVITFSLKQSSKQPEGHEPTQWVPPKKIMSEFDKETRDANLNDD